MIFVFIQALRREFLLNSRQIRSIANACLFFCVILLFFPLTMEKIPATLHNFLPCILWLSLFFAVLLYSERTFKQEYDDGVIEQWLLTGEPLWLKVFAKLFTQWLWLIVPVILVSPFLLLLYKLDIKNILVIDLSLLVGSPTLLFLCALASAFTSTISQKGLLMALVVIPLSIPVLIFGSGVVIMASEGNQVNGILALLSGISLLTIGILPFAISGIVRVCMVD